MSSTAEVIASSDSSLPSSSPPFIPTVPSDPDMVALKLSRENGSESGYRSCPAGESASSMFTPEQTRRRSVSNNCSSCGLIAELDGTQQHSAEGQISGQESILPVVEHQGSVELPPAFENELFEPSGSSFSVLHSHTRHVFILSDAGKPIYSRHGNEEDFSTLMGVMQALVSFVQTRDDFIQSFCHGKWKFVFLRRNALILVACAAVDDSVAQLREQLNFIYYQILSTLTRTQLIRIFENKRNFDLRRLLAGTEKTVHALVDISSTDPSHLLCAVRCLPLGSTVRESLGQALVSSASRVKNLVFAILIARQQLITMVRLRKYTLHPSDLHLLINLVECNPSFRNAESWSPVCLPRFDDTGFLHAHISYLQDTCPVCLLLLTVDRNAFFTLSEIREKFLEKLNKNKMLIVLSDACNAKQGIGLVEVGIPDVLHFLYKNRSSSQLCCSTFEQPYINEAERLRLVERYLRLIDRIHNAEELEQPLRILYTTGDKEAVLGWVTSNFELYAAFNPMITKQAAVAKVDKLMKWLKKEEERLFILNPLVL